METKDCISNTTDQKTSRGAEVTAIDTMGQQPGETPDCHAKSQVKNPLVTRFLRWLIPEKRRNERRFVPLFAYFGTICSSQPYEVGDISAAGFYMITPERWFPGSPFPVTLQRTDTNLTERDGSISVQAKVVRLGPDGMGFAFVLEDSQTTPAGSMPGCAATQEDMDRFLKAIQLPSHATQEWERAS
jgi:hypothetical protein